MKKWILYWKHYWLALILGTLFLFGAGYFVCEFAYNRLTAEYVYYFQTTESDVSYLKTEDFLRLYSNRSMLTISRLKKALKAVR